MKTFLNEKKEEDNTHHAHREQLNSSPTLFPDAFTALSQDLFIVCLFLIFIEKNK